MKVLVHKSQLQKICKYLKLITGADLYKRMNWYVMSEDVLVSNGFPRPDTEHTGCAVISTEVSNKKSSNRK